MIASPAARRQDRTRLTDLPPFLIIFPALPDSPMRKTFYPCRRNAAIVHSFLKFPAVGVMILAAATLLNGGDSTSSDTSTISSRIAHIYIKGNKITRSSAVMAYLELSTGSLFDSLALKGAERRLRATDLFLNVHILFLHLSYGYDLYVLLTEYPLYFDFPPSFYISRYDYYHGRSGHWYTPSAGMSFSNIGGTTESLALFAKVGGWQTFSASWQTFIAFEIFRRTRRGIRPEPGPIQIHGFSRSFRLDYLRQAVFRSVKRVYRHPAGPLLDRGLRGHYRRVVPDNRGDRLDSRPSLVFVRSIERGAHTGRCANQPFPTRCNGQSLCAGFRGYTSVPPVSLYRSQVCVPCLYAPPRPGCGVSQAGACRWGQFGPRLRQ